MCLRRNIETEKTNQFYYVNKSVRCPPPFRQELRSFLPPPSQNGPKMTKNDKKLPKWTKIPRKMTKIPRKIGKNTNF